MIYPIELEVQKIHVCSNDYALYCNAYRFMIHVWLGYRNARWS